MHRLNLVKCSFYSSFKIGNFLSPQCYFPQMCSSCSASSFPICSVHYTKLFFFVSSWGLRLDCWIIVSIGSLANCRRWNVLSPHRPAIEKRVIHKSLLLRHVEEAVGSPVLCSVPGSKTGGSLPTHLTPSWQV